MTIKKQLQKIITIATSDIAQGPETVDCSPAQYRHRARESKKKNRLFFHARSRIHKPKITRTILTMNLFRRVKEYGMSFVYRKEDEVEEITGKLIRGALYFEKANRWCFGVVYFVGRRLYHGRPRSISIRTSRLILVPEIPCPRSEPVRQRVALWLEMLS